MDVACTRVVDEDADHDPPEYRYEFDVYRFSEGSLAYAARGYTDTPDEASLLRAEEHGTARLLTPADLHHPLFQAGVAHLHSDGKRTLTWLDGERGAYVPVEAPSRTA